MAKFTQDEREIIKNTLLDEGEKLFARFGIKKVTVDELTKIAKISKGSFYSFYLNKEELYIDIITKKQEEIWDNLDNLMQESKGINPKILMKRIFVKYIQLAEESEILKKMDAGFINYIARRLPDDVIDNMGRGTSLDFSDFDIKFREDVYHISRALEELFKVSLSLNESDAENKEIIMNILIEGLVIRSIY